MEQTHEAHIRQAQVLGNGAVTAAAGVRKPETPQLMATLAVYHATMAVYARLDQALEGLSKLGVQV